GFALLLQVRTQVVDVQSSLVQLGLECVDLSQGIGEIGFAFLMGLLPSRELISELFVFSNLLIPFLLRVAASKKNEWGEQAKRPVEGCGEASHSHLFVSCLSGGVEEQVSGLASLAGCRQVPVYPRFFPVHHTTVGPNPHFR